MVLFDWLCVCLVVWWNELGCWSSVPSLGVMAVEMFQRANNRQRMKKVRWEDEDGSVMEDGWNK